MLLSLAIAAFATALIVITWTGIVSLNRLSREEAVAASRRHNHTIAAALEVYVARTLRSTAGVLSYVERERAREGERFDTVEMTRTVDTRLFHSIALTDARGRVIHSFPNSYPLSHDLAGREAYRQYQRGQIGFMHIGRPVRSPVTREMVIPVSRPRLAPDGQFLGMVTAELRPQAVLGLFGDGGSAPRGVMSLIRRDGTLLVSHAEGRLRYGTDLRGSPILLAQARSPRGTIRMPSLLDGIERDLSYRTIGAFPDLIVVLGTSTQDILGPVQRGRRAYYFGASLVTLLVLGFAVALIAGIYRKWRADEELGTVVDRLHAAQRLARIGDWRLDYRSGKLFWSPQMYEFFGRDPVKGPLHIAEMAEIVGPEMQKRGQQAFEAARESDRPQGFDCALEASTGDLRHYQVVAAAVRNDDGEVVAMAGTMQDVSARRKVETLQDELARLARLDAVNTMAATLAHELNQPLAAAANYLSVARYLSDQIDHERSELLAEQLDQSEDQIQRAGHIIRRIRNMISRTSGDKEVVQIDQIVTEALAVVAMAKICPDIPIEADGPGRSLAVRADPIQIQQVLLNLIRNAAEAQRGVANPVIRIRIEPEGAMVQITVCDHGPGMPAEIRENLFDPFSTSKADGLGLGLSISRTIVEAHGGRIWTEAEPGGGTRVHFTLPYAQSDSATDHAGGAPSPA